MERLKKEEDKMTQTPEIQSTQTFKLFDMFDVSGIELKDPALKPYLNLEPKLLLKSQGRNVGKFGKARVNILERMSNRIAVSGHIGKKHKLITSHSSGQYNKNMKTIIKTMEIIQQKTNKNPIQVLVDAINNGSPRDEITVIEHAGARYPQAVDCSPTRRIDLALRWMTQGAHQKSFGKKKKIAFALAEEIIKASERNMESFAYSKKNEAEKQADSAR